MRLSLLFATLLTLVFSPVVAEETLALIKPDAVKQNKANEIIHLIRENGLEINQVKIIHMTPEEAGHFYKKHKDRPFFQELTDYMSSGPLIAMILESDNAISRYRELIGTTDPKEALPGTLRALYGTDRGENAVHGSESADAARDEIRYFFCENHKRATPAFKTQGQSKPKIASKIGSACFFMSK